MATQPALSEADLEKALSDLVALVKMISGAMAGSISFFAVIVVYLYAHAAPKVPADGAVRMLAVLSGAHALAAVAMYAASARLYSQMVSPERVAAAGFVSAVQTAEIVRLAMGEGPAMLGLVVCFLGSLNGVLAAYPLFWLNAVSAVVFIWDAYSLMRTPERFRELSRSLRAP